MRAQKILFATDFSDHASSLVKVANRLASDDDARLYLLHVVEPVAPIGAAVPYHGALVDQNDTLLTAMLDEYADSNVQYESHVSMGDPATEIVQFAKDYDIDMIVIGTHGRTGLTRFLMGSVAEAVVRQAPCPVLTIKEGAKVFAGELS